MLWSEMLKEALDGGLLRNIHMVHLPRGWERSDSFIDSQSIFCVVKKKSRPTGFQQQDDYCTASFFIVSLVK